MSASLNINAETRTESGKGAVRRLRTQGYIPAIVYGGEDAEPQSIKIKHDEILHSLENEAFYSSILQMTLDGNQEKVVLKAVQRHPAKINIMHLDLLRVRGKSEINMTVPLHFENSETAKGVKMGGVVDTHFTEVEVRCMAKDLPESLAVDLEDMDIGDSLSLSEIKLPEGVILTAFIGVEEDEIQDRDQTVVQVIEPRVAEEPEEELEAAEGEAEGEGEAEVAEDTETPATDSDQ